jgi:hypothetical protein
VLSTLSPFTIIFFLSICTFKSGKTSQLKREVIKIKNLKKIMQEKEIDLPNKIILIKKPIKVVHLLKVDEYKYKKRIYKRNDYPRN